jgi:iron complex transport system substrate-binding protein
MRAVAPLLVALSLALSACAAERPSAGPPAPSPPDRAGGWPVSIAAANGRVTIPERPGRIVSLSPTATEMLFAIGAGGQVTAVDDNSDYPRRAPTTSLSGYEPNVEAVAARDPDLVVLSNDPGGMLRSLKALDIPALLQPAAQTFDDSYAQIEQLGAATGHIAEAAELVATMRARIDATVAAAPTVWDGKPPTYYHELDQNFFTVTSETFIGHVYSRFGLRNIADRAGGAGSGYPQLSPEYIIGANPDLVFLADTRCCDVTAEVVAARPGWDQLSAVQRGHVYAIDDDVASRWGPRIVRLVRVVARAVRKLESDRA